MRGYALIDDCDAAQARHRWCMNASGYAVRRNAGGIVRLSRELLGLGRGDPRVGDHINGDRLDNRRANLRVVTVAENAQNLRPGMGVTRCGDGWKASVWHRARRLHLGVYRTIDDARAAAAAWRAANRPYSAEARDARR